MKILLIKLGIGFLFILLSACEKMSFQEGKNNVSPNNLDSTVALADSNSFMTYICNSDNTATVYWTPREGALSYSLFFVQEDSDWRGGQELSLKYSDLFATINTLPGIFYYVKLRPLDAQQKEYNIDAHAAITVSCGGASPKPPKPVIAKPKLSFVCVEDLKGGLTLKWTPTIFADQYIIEWNNLSKPIFDCTKKSDDLCIITKNAYEIGHLTFAPPGYTYKIRIIAKSNKQETLAESEIVNVKCGEL